MVNASTCLHLSIEDDSPIDIDLSPRHIDVARQRDLRRYQIAGLTLCPVMKCASLEARYATTLAMFAGVPLYPRGDALSI